MFYELICVDSGSLSCYSILWIIKSPNQNVYHIKTFSSFRPLSAFEKNPIATHRYELAY